MSKFNVSFTDCSRLNKKGKDLTQRMLIKDLKSKKQALQLKKEGWCKLDRKTLATHENPEVRDKTLAEFKRIRDGIKQKGTKGERDDSTSRSDGDKGSKGGWWDETKGWVTNNPGKSGGIAVGAAALVVAGIIGIKKLKGGATQYRFGKDGQGETLEVLKVKKDKKTNTDKIGVTKTIRGRSLEVFKLIKDSPSTVSDIQRTFLTNQDVVTEQDIKDAIKELSKAKLISKGKENKYSIRKGVTEYTPPAQPAAPAAQPAGLAPGQMTYVQKKDDSGQNVVQVVVKRDGKPIAVKIGDAEKHTFDQWQIPALEAISGGPTQFDPVAAAVWPIAKQYGYQDEHYDGFLVQLRATLEPFQVDDNVYHFNAVDEAKIASQMPQPQAPETKTPAPMPQPVPTPQPQAVPQPEPAPQPKPAAAPPPRPGSVQPAAQPVAPPQGIQAPPDPVAPPPRPGSQVPPPRKSSSEAKTVVDPAPAPQPAPSRTSVPTAVQKPQADPPPRPQAEPAPVPEPTAEPTPTSTPTKPNAFNLSIPPGLDAGLKTSVDPVGPTEAIDVNAVIGDEDGSTTQEMETLPAETGSVEGADEGAPSAHVVAPIEDHIFFGQDLFPQELGEVIKVNLKGNADAATMLPYKILVSGDPGKTTYGDVLKAMKADIFSGGYGLSEENAINMANRWAIKEVEYTFALDALYEGQNSYSDYFTRLAEVISSEPADLDEGEGMPLDLGNRALHWLDHGIEGNIALPLFAHLGAFAISASVPEENQEAATKALNEGLEKLASADLDKFAAEIQSMNLEDIEVLKQEGNEAYLYLAQGLKDMALASVYYQMGKIGEAMASITSAQSYFADDVFEPFKEHADALAAKIGGTSEGSGSGSTSGSGGIDRSKTLVEKTTPTDPGISESKGFDASAGLYVDPNAAEIMAGADPVDIGAIGTVADSAVQKPLFKTSVETPAVSVAVIGNEASGGAIIIPTAGVSNSSAPQSISLFNSPTRPMALPLHKVTS
jgi:hypothetical protein